jgi:chromate transporter
MIPGPNSTEVAIHVGYARAGWRGLLTAGICFIAPSMLMVGGLGVDLRDSTDRFPTFAVFCTA